MKKFKYVTFVTLIFVLSIMFSSKVLGASKYSMQIDGASTATRGSNITLTLNAKNIGALSDGFSGYSGKISYDTTKLQFVDATGSIRNWDFGTTDQSGTINFIGYDNFAPANTKKSDSEIFKIIFKVSNDATGSVTFTVSNIKGTTESGTSLTADSVSKTVTITDPVASKSSDTNLSNLSVNGHSISPSFNPATTSYTLTVPNNVSSIDVSAVPADSKSTVSVTGNSNLSVGKNTVLVEVRAEDGSKKTYKIEVTRNAPASSGTQSNPPASTKPSTSTKSKNNNLKSIDGIPGLEFDPNKTEYDVTLPFETTNINVTATPEDEKSKISYSNANLKDLAVDKNNTITIAVTAEDSSIKIYTINVKRSPYKSETDLKELVVNKEDIYKEGEDSYKVVVPSDTNTLDISAIPKSEGSTVKIIGGENLKAGNNTVVVEVTDKNGFKKSYTLNVEKQTDSFLLDFLKNWWLLLLAMLFILIILLILIYLHERNKKLLEDISNNESKYILEKNTNPNNAEVVYYPERDENSSLETQSHIDNTYNIVYNSNNNNTISGKDMDTYIPRHSDDDSINKILDDDSVSEVQIVRNESYGDDQLDKEYKIIEKYRKK